MGRRKIGRVLALPIPGAIAGMVLLLILLQCFGRRLAPTMEAASMPLLKHMMLFFIPSVAGVMEQFQALRAGWLPFVIASIAGCGRDLGRHRADPEMAAETTGHRCLMTDSATLISVAHTSLTVVAYILALWAYRRSGWGLLLPVLTGAATVAVVLVVTNTPYGTYREGASLLSWLAGPATVALAFSPVPPMGPLAASGGLSPRRAAGGAPATAVVSAIVIAWLLGGDWALMMSLAPKSATMPVAMPVAERMGGAAPLSAVAVALTGIAAAVLASGLFSLLGVRSEMVRGFALGAAAHAIGTARAFQIGETAMGSAALAMGLNAIATSVLVPLIAVLL